MHINWSVQSYIFQEVSFFIQKYLPAAHRNLDLDKFLNINLFEKLKLNVIYALTSKRTKIEFSFLIYEYPSP